MAKLRTETNDAETEADVLHAAYQADLGNLADLSADFEHGQWWITNLTNGGQWSVCDAEGSEDNGVFAGFCFEEVTAPEEE